SVSLGGDIFIKTHAHSMKPEYRLNEPDSVIPHCYPATIKVFECLEQACAAAGVELRFVSVNDVVERLAALDGEVATAVWQDRDAKMPIAPSAWRSDAPAADAAPSTSPDVVRTELIELHRAWLAGDGGGLPADDLYLAKLAHNSPLEPYEIELAAKIAERYTPDLTRVVEIGMGWAAWPSCWRDSVSRSWASKAMPPGIQLGDGTSMRRRSDIRRYADVF